MDLCRIHVLLADDNPLFIDGFRHALTRYGIVVSSVADSTASILPCYKETQPDVLVVDVRFDSKRLGNNLNGLDVCEQLLAECRDAKIMVFSQFDDLYIIEKAYKLGALAFVLKDEAVDVLAHAIREVAMGQEFFTPSIAQLLARSSVLEHNPSKLLDAKESKAFLLTADGCSFTEIAQVMGISTKTVGTLLKSVRSKLSIESVADFTKLAIRYGLLSTQPRTKN